MNFDKSPGILKTWLLSYLCCSKALIKRVNMSELRYHLKIDESLTGYKFGRQGYQPNAFVERTRNESHLPSMFDPEQQRVLRESIRSFDLRDKRAKPYVSLSVDKKSIA